MSKIMNNENDFDATSKKKYKVHFNQNDICLKESDFYPPSDNRVLKSYIRDVNGGDSFADYCKDLFEHLEEEGYYDD